MSIWPGSHWPPPNRCAERQRAPVRRRVRASNDPRRRQLRNRLRLPLRLPKRRRLPPLRLRPEPPNRRKRVRPAGDPPARVPPRRRPLHCRKTGLPATTDRRCRETSGSWSWSGWLRKSPSVQGAKFWPSVARKPYSERGIRRRGWFSLGRPPERTRTFKGNRSWEPPVNC